VVTRQQDGAPAHRSIYTLAILQTNVPDFTEPSRQTGQLFNLGCSSAAGVSSEVQNINHLKQFLTSCWDMVSQELTVLLPVV